MCKYLFTTPPPPPHTHQILVNYLSIYIISTTINKKGGVTIAVWSAA
jgi:hypothetical protein